MPPQLDSWQSWFGISIEAGYGDEDVFIRAHVIEAVLCQSGCRFLFDGPSLAADYGRGGGLWLLENGTWARETDADPLNLLGWRGGLQATFAEAQGLFYRDLFEGWKLLAGLRPEQMLDWRGKLVADFGAGGGLWSYDGSAWTFLTPGNAHSLAVEGRRLAVSFEDGARCLGLRWLRMDEARLRHRRMDRADTLGSHPRCTNV